MIRVLLVEDDAMIREMTRIFLESQKRFEVVCAASGEEALAHAKDPFDVILLDILLPDTNGMQLCQTLRSGHHCPIIFTSCLDDVDTIVHALELGGDDFLTKPYDNKVLVARILANVRRVQMDAAEPSLRGYTCPAFRLDADNRSVHCRGEDIHLADMEYRILSLFVRNPNTFFTANELYQKIWGKDSLGDVRTVQVHIHNLRGKIEHLDKALSEATEKREAAEREADALRSELARINEARKKAESEGRELAKQLGERMVELKAAKEEERATAVETNSIRAQLSKAETNAKRKEELLCAALHTIKTEKSIKEGYHQSLKWCMAHPWRNLWRCVKEHFRF